MAGTGKSTISRTIAKSLATTNQLGASFFFKRGEVDRSHASKLFTTVASQIARRIPTLAGNITEAIDADPTVHNKGLREQFEKLIFKPLSQIQGETSCGVPIAVVVDALDECKSEDDIKMIINLFSRAKNLQSLRLKVLLTSRPELSVRLGFKQKGVEDTYTDFILHEIPEHVVEHNISVFLEDQLALIRDNYNSTVSSERQLPPTWPGQGNIQALVKMAVPLFIFAATTCRFVRQRGFGGPDLQLRQVLDYRTGVESSELDLPAKFELTYQPALNQQLVNLSRSEQNVTIKQFRRIVGTIVILLSPLTTTALGKLLSIPKYVIDGRLDMLHSVLDVPKSSISPVRLLHLSFRDFLVDPKQQDKNPFWVDEKETHRQLAVRCLTILKEHLHVDICDLKSPATLRKTVDPLRVNICLPPEIQYACLSWAYHTRQSQAGSDLADDIYTFLSQHFLYWLEALSLLGRAYEAVALLKSVQSQGMTINKNRLQEFVSDAIRFIRMNLYIISTAPLQLYSSALIFTPYRSVIRQIFEEIIPQWIVLKPDVETDWNQCLQKLEGHSHEVCSVAFSHDSAIIASASWDKTVRIWCTDTGECIQELKGHTDRVTSVAFSHDSALIVSASWDKTVWIWCTNIGECIHKLKGHSDRVTSVAFSHDSALIASASWDKTVRIWCTDTGECIQELKGYTDRVISVAFSHDSALIASASYDVQIRQTNTGNCILELKGHSFRACSVAFSHNSTLIASASDEIVRIWRADTGEYIQELEGHSEWVRSVTFSHDSTLIASASDDKTVRIWRTDTGECIQELKGNRGELSVAFSHNSALIISASRDNIIRIWHTDIGEYTQELKGHSDSVGSVVFSHNSALIASASRDKTVRIWHTNTGECTQELKGHSDWVRSVAFSHNSVLLASASDDMTVRIWHTDTVECTQELKGHSDIVILVAFSHDSALLASASNDETVRIWQTNTGDCILELEGHSYGASSVAFSHNSALIASASRDRILWVWHTNTGECIQELKGHSGRVTSVAFSYNSALIASASWDKTVRIWRTNTGECTQELEGHSDRVQSVAFSHDSVLIASASHDMTVRIWRTDIGQCMQVADIGTTSSHLSFDPGNTYLHTDRGVVVLHNATSELLSLSPEAQRQITTIHEIETGVSQDDCWVTWKDDNLLWLPTEFRPLCSAVHGCTLVVGCNSGRVIIVRLSHP